MTDAKQDSILEALKNTDSWTNLVTGLGYALQDKRLSTEVGTPAILSRQDLEDLFSGNKLAQKICHAPAAHMLREWLVVQGDEDNTGLGDDVQARMDELGILAMLIEAITWARLHGGAVVVMGADDGLDPLQPLREDGIRTLSWFTTLDRWDIQPKRYYADPLAPRYGLPEVYEIVGGSVPGEAAQAFGRLIHESRVLRFDGTLTTRRRMVRNNGWADSVFVAIYEELRMHGHTLSSAETLVCDFSQAVYKYKGLADAISAQGADLIQLRAQVIDMTRSVLRAMVIDADGEEFERKTTPLTGLPDLMDRFMMYLAAVADMPATVLFGRSPAGENATGESDIRTWYDRLAAERQLYVAPQVERLVKLLLLAKDGPTKGREPEDWRIGWNPLWQHSEAEKIANRKAQAETDAIYIERQVLDPDEVADSRFGGTEYSHETELDTETRAAMEAEAEKEPAEPESPPQPQPMMVVQPKPGDDEGDHEDE